MLASRLAFLLSSLALTSASLMVVTPAAAQWVWKDESGHTVASDQPPPTGTPQSRIVKEPRTRKPLATPAPVTDQDAAAKADAPKTLADRDLESRQRQKEAAEAAKKADDEAAKARAMQENCSAVKGNLAGLQAGGRASRVNEKGERTYLDDNQRAGEISKAQSQIAQYCK